MPQIRLPIYDCAWHCSTPRRPSLICTWSRPMQPDMSPWRVKESYDYLERLPPEGLAWEFLRRNTNYQRDYTLRKSERRSRGKADTEKQWGLLYLVDPTETALGKPVYWSPKADPAVLVIIRTPDLFEPKIQLDIPVSLTQKSAGGFNAVSVFDDCMFNVIFTASSKPTDPCTALLPIDEDCLSRIETLTRFWRALHGRTVPADTRLTSQQRRRIRLMMQAFDGRDNNATYREIADVIYGASRVAADAWKTSALRDSTIALVKDGKAMVEGEYLQLLKHRRRN